MHRGEPHRMVNKTIKGIEIMNVCRTAGTVLCVVGALMVQGCASLAWTGTTTAVSVAQDRRTTGTYIDDELIELKIFAAIREDEELRTQSHVSATSFNGLVLLTGEAPGESLRSRVTEIARKIPKVRGVQNEVMLGAPSTLSARANDVLLTGRVKVALLEEPSLNVLHVKVVTERGVVYLMGLLTQQEADRAADAARRIAGVQRVVLVAEYL